MIEEFDIQYKIDIIFQQEIDNLESGIFFSYIDNSDPEMAYRDAIFKRDEIIKATSIGRSIMQAKTKFIRWDTFSTLKKLYNEIEGNQTSRSIFIRIMNEKLINDDSDKPRRGESSSLGFYFLMKIGKIDETVRALIELFNENREKGTFSFREDLLFDIYVFMAMEPDYFDDDTLVLLKELNNSCGYFGAGSSEFKKRFNLHVNNLRYINLKNELKGINEELNIDKERVIDMMTKYGFPSLMEDFLLQIDQIPESSEWDTINSGMIGNLRSFYEELIRNISESIKEKSGDEFPNNSKGEMGNKRSYIKQHLELTKNDDKLISSYVNILHKEGGHSFISEKKYYRLTKNIGIEIAYFLLSKLEVFLER